MTRVVHCQEEAYDVLISRPSKWGNPYTHINDKQTLAQFVVETRELAIEKYREYIMSNEKLLAEIDELEGKTLGCWCKPKSCHGDILIELLTAKKLKAYLNK